MEDTKTATQRLQELLNTYHQASNERIEVIQKMPEQDRQIVIDGCTAQMRRSTRSILNFFLPIITVLMVMKTVTNWDVYGTNLLVGVIGFFVYLMCSKLLMDNSTVPMSSANDILKHHGSFGIHSEHPKRVFQSWLYSDPSGENILQKISSDRVLKENIGAGFEFGSLGILLLVSTSSILTNTSSLLEPFVTMLPLTVLFVREPIIRKVAINELNNLIH